jgi:hypothetical protein
MTVGSANDDTKPQASACDWTGHVFNVRFVHFRPGSALPAQTPKAQTGNNVMTPNRRNHPTLSCAA